MPKQPRRERDLTPVAKALEDARGTAGFDAFIASEAQAVLMTMFPFHDGLCDAERRIAIIRGMGRVVPGPQVTARRLAQAIRQEEKKLLATPEQPFVLATQLSISPPMGVRPRLMNGVRLVSALPRRIQSARLKLEREIPDEDRHVAGYVGTLTRVKARTPLHAFDLAIERLDLLRGIWNFVLTSKTLFAWHADPSSPLGRVRNSRVQTLHEAGGALAIDTYWFDPQFRLLTSTHITAAEWERMQRLLRQVRARLQTITYRSAIERALVEYARALDATDMATAYLKLWGILELLSGAGGERYDVLVRRVAFQYEPDLFIQTVLEHLRVQRNEIAHSGTPQADLRAIVYQVKRFAEQMLGFHLSMGRKFTSLEEAGTFMDLCDDPSKLRRQAQLLRYALKWQRA